MGLRGLFSRRHRYEEQGVEPDYVEVEPVLGRQLECYEQGSSQRCHLHERLSSWPEGKADCQEARGDQDGYAERPEAWDLAPDAEGGVAVGLVGDRAVVDRVQAGVDCWPKHQETDGRQGDQSADRDRAEAMSAGG